MGFLDKIKHFAGGHGVSVRITRVERQDPSDVKFPYSDTVMKFNIEVSGEKPVTILSHDFEVWVERTTEENGRIIQAGEESHGEGYEIGGTDLHWPYELKPGDVIEDGCCMEVDLGTALKKMDVANPPSVLNDPNYRFFVKFTADVKGSPMDAEAECDFKVVP